MVISAVDCGYCAEMSFFVSPDGDDAHPGTKAQPFKTLEAARDAVRKSDHQQKMKGLSRSLAWLNLTQST